MSRKKLLRFQQNTESHNVIEPGKPLFESIKGNWLRDYFQNLNPIVLELGCGMGEYTVGLARVFTNKNFIGVDIKGDRIARGSQAALGEQLKNVAFVRTKIQEIERFFDENEVDEIWITFPDPRPRNKDIKRRLTSPRFIEMYRRIIKPRGLLHLKTDSESLFDYSLDVLQNTLLQDVVFTKDLYQSALANDHFGIKTKYEGIFSAQGFKINYLRGWVNK